MPYHPQTDRLVERFNSTLKGMLRKFVSRNEKDWDEYLHTYSLLIVKFHRIQLGFLHMIYSMEGM